MDGLFGHDNVLRQPLSAHLVQACGQVTGAQSGAPGAAQDGTAAIGEGVLGEWAPLVRRWLHSPKGQALVAAVERRQSAGAIVYPSRVLHALALTPLAKVRVLILGQDPYHGPGQAQGLAFSVPAGTRLPPSLRNILQEIRRDLGAVSDQACTGDLRAWARQGVLLLNTALTVEDGQAGSHARLGWESLTDAIVGAIARQPGPLVAMLWGAHAQAKAPLLGPDAAPAPGAPAGAARLILQSNHPSPLSARRPPVPFLGCGHFSQAQAFLSSHDTRRPPIIW
jgi:uracil-DNA glycosylase